MPELPEVEVICRDLNKILPNAAVDEVIIRSPKLRYAIDYSMADTLRGAIIERVERRAKVIQIFLKNNTRSYVVLIHLGMSGRLMWYDMSISDYSFEKHDHIVLTFKNLLGCLVYNDPRRFGFVELMQENELHHNSYIKKAGVEPLNDNFNGDFFYKITRNSNRAIKNLLMDHSIIVGVGNIYACEVLWDVGLCPKRPSHSLNIDKCINISRSLKDILRRAIAAGGSTLKDFRKLSGEDGGFQMHHSVYGRTGEECKRCGTTISREVIGGRSTFFCKQCQI